MTSRECLELAVVDDDSGGRTSEERIDLLRFAVTNALALMDEGEKVETDFGMSSAKVRFDRLVESEDPQEVLLKTRDFTILPKARALLGNGVSAEEVMLEIRVGINAALSILNHGL